MVVVVSATVVDVVVEVVVGGNVVDVVGAAEVDGPAVVVGSSVSWVVATSVS